MKGIILEGVSASGKSTVLKLLQKKILDEKPNSTKLFISEHYTQRMLEHKLEAGELDFKTVQNHVDKVINNIKTYQKMLDESKFASNPSGAEAFITLERFLLTFIATHHNTLDNIYSTKVAHKQFQNLKSMSITQYVLVLSKDRLKENLERTLTHRNEFWASYVESKGGVDGMAQTSFEWQERILSLTKELQNSIVTKVLEVGDWNYQGIAKEIYDDVYAT